METLKYRSLFNPGGCLTALTFTRYLDNALRPADKVRVEEHLRHCLICTEALEGYKRHRNTTFMKTDLEFLTGKIRKRYSSGSSKKYGLPVSILITLFIFLIILLIIYYLIRYFLLSA